MSRTVFVRGKRYTIKSSQLLQSGGEGMVFDVGGKALKLYHRPSRERARKLCDWLHGAIAPRLPPNILGPGELVLDGRGKTVGFTMPLLPADGVPMKVLAYRDTWTRQQLDRAAVISIFQEIHSNIQWLHKYGVVVGDLNDQGIYCLLAGKSDEDCGAQTFWIDVDSFQFGHHACSVAMEAFLDPHLYGAVYQDGNGCFGEGSDWYAFFVLLIRSLLLVHPFGGVHHAHKSLQTRAAAGVSILNPEVKYPTLANPLESLSDELLHQAHCVFERGERPPFRASMLSRYAASLVRCPTCNLSYPNQRSGCPACRTVTPVHVRPKSVDPAGERLILEVGGTIEHVAARPDGRIYVITYENRSYRLIRAGASGLLDQRTLFAGGPGYSFGFFGPPAAEPCLVVSPDAGAQLLVLALAGHRVQQLSLLETGTFAGRAVFAASSAHLYRIAGNWIMRGSVRDGHFLEEGIATAHKNQANFWASPHRDRIAGFHRIFEKHCYFLLDGNGEEIALQMPALHRGESIRDVAFRFSPEAVALSRTIKRDGRLRDEVVVFDDVGTVLHRRTRAAGDPGLSVSLAQRFPITADSTLPTPPYILAPPTFNIADGDAVYLHDEGLLVKRRQRLLLLPIRN